MQKQVCLLYQSTAFPITMPPKFKRLNEEQEDRLLVKARNEPNLTLEQLAEWLTKEFHLQTAPNKSSISRCLKRKCDAIQDAGENSSFSKKQNAGKLSVRCICNNYSTVNNSNNLHVHYLLVGCGKGSIYLDDSMSGTQHSIELERYCSSRQRLCEKNGLFGCRFQW